MGAVERDPVFKKVGVVEQDESYPLFRDVRLSMNARHTSTTGPCRDTWESDSIVGTKTVGEGIRPRTQHQNPRQLSPPNPTDKPLTLIPRKDQTSSPTPSPFHVPRSMSRTHITS
ncbi:MAG: hypothetical protein B5766_08680 [Candidatus Lumbricidophila eiseniae]|uniref:Uncharacterized protein n=1 Tax=Candidatus Lumbricidiphila eiseniae TaxID=1969409 RepID=A0A2A6FQK2_9MICO|nr:MAG: hypothetical protein B5766_08680 [Candidatus Lumbricidophila eiseniae]